jgi:hypothetical protein
VAQIESGIQPPVIEKESRSETVDGQGGVATQTVQLTGPHHPFPIQHAFLHVPAARQ